MNKNLLCSVAAAAFFGAGILSSHLFKSPAATTATHAKPFKIAILTPVSVPALDEIERGVKETLNKSSKAQYQFQTFNANGERTLMNSFAQKITQQDFDAIVTLGSGATQVMYEVSTKRKCTTPLIFTAVETPVEMGIIKSTSCSGNHVTGIEELIDTASQIAALKALCPDITTLAIAYNPSVHGLQLLKTEYEKNCAAAGITLKLIEIFQTNELSHKISSGIQNCQALLIMKDVTVASGIDLLVKLCNKYHVTLMASDLDSGTRGAAIAHGVYENDFGKLAAHKVQAILENKKSPSELPIEPNNGFHVMLNNKTMKTQGLDLTKRELFVLKNCSITGELK